MIQTHTYTLRSKVWIYPGHAAWHFVSIPQKESADIKKKFGVHARGFGSLPVSVTVGASTWRTSIFPDSKSGTYLLPLKKAIRAKEHIQSDATLSYTITIPPQSSVH